MVSLPEPPESVSLPASPLTVSAPAWPFRVSLPASPRRVSFPPLPLIVSFPPPPQITSAPEVPVRVSAPVPPTMVQPAAFGTTVVGSDALLFEPFGSGSLATAEAELVSVPTLGGRTTTVTVAWLPPTIDPSEHVTVPVPEHDPWDGVMETTVGPAGGVSVRTTPVGSGAPRSWTLTT